MNLFKEEFFGNFHLISKKILQTSEGDEIQKHVQEENLHSFKSSTILIHPCNIAGWKITNPISLYNIFLVVQLKKKKEKKKRNNTVK